MDFNGDLNLSTLQTAPVFPELYQELWWYSGSYAFSGSVAYYVQKGGTGSVSTTSSATKLITINANASPNTLYALELAGCVSLSSDNMSVELWDMTTNNAVAGTSLTFSTTTFVVARSGQFKLTPGHSYGIMYQSMSGSPSMLVTDASLIVFPNAPLTSPSVSAISLSNASGNTLKEAYIPLWVDSSDSVFISAQTTGGHNFVQKGTTNQLSGTTGATLLTLSTNWNANQRFAFEASIRSNGNTANAEIWDLTTNTAIASSNVSTSNTIFTLIRSGSFILTPGHSYGVTMWNPNSSYNAYLTKAHLVALAN